MFVVQNKTKKRRKNERITRNIDEKLKKNDKNIKREANRDDTRRTIQTIGTIHRRRVG